MALAPPTAMISLQLAASLRDKLNAIARERSVPRSRVLEWILKAGVASYEAEFGLLRVLLRSRASKETRGMKPVRSLVGQAKALYRTFALGHRPIIGIPESAAS
jgi:hypothetical protein